MAAEDASPAAAVPEDDVPLESDDDEAKAPAATTYEGLFETVNGYTAKVWSAAETVSAQHKQMQAGRVLYMHGLQEFERQVATSGPGALFTDADFPAEAVSLCHDWVHAKVSIQWRDFLWRRPRDVVLDDEDKPQLFSHAVSSNDIHQGALADCYILSAMSALAEDPKAVQRLFPPERQRPDLGLYTVRLCVRGHWRNILVDDQLPCFSHREGAELVFSRGAGNDMWVPLVEKALAKEAGSFQALESNESYSGQAGETLSTFTGAPCEYIASSEDRIFEQIHAATCRAPGFTNNGWFVVAVLPDGAGDMHAEDLGLVVRHSYAVLDAREVTLAPAGGEGGEPQTQRILQLRNPWGEAKWRGSYAPGSADWTPEVLQQLAGDTGQHALEGVHAAENGVFWLSLADFTHYFAGVQICRASKDMSDSSDDVHIAPGETAVLALTIKGDGPVVVDLSALQHDTHMLAVKHHAHCQLVGMRMQVVDVKTHTLVGATQLLQQRDVWLGIPSLAPGKYWVLVETDWDGTARPDVDDAKGGIKIAVSVRTTAPEVDILAVPPVTDAVMGVDGKVIKRAMLHAMCLGCPAQDMGQLFPSAPPRKLAKNITKRVFTGEDTVAWLYENDSRSLCLTETLPFELHNMQVVEGHNGRYRRRETELVTVSVRPGESRLLAVQQARAGWFRWNIINKEDTAGREEGDGAEASPYAEARLEDV